MPVVIAQPECVDIGAEVSIAAFVHIWGGGGVKIGRHVMIGSHSAITSITHDYRRRDMFEGVLREVVIEDEVWIGSHVVVLPGTRIGAGAVVGAGSVVTRDVPPAAVVAGAPARVIKTRAIDAEAPLS
jgi:maltose O-acetyltransferase